MNRTGRVLLLTFLFSALAMSAQCQQTVPAFTGVWTLNLGRSRIEAKHAPISSTVTIRYDGSTWWFSRTHQYPDGKSDTRTMTLPVGSKTARIERRPHETIASRMSHDGDLLVLNQDYTADTGEKATNTVRYSLTEGGNTLVEDEREVTPEGSEHNIWVLERSRASE